MLTVSHLAKSAQVTPDTVRHYVHLGLLKPKRHPDNAYQLFKPEDAQRLRFIQQAKFIGFNLKEIKKILQQAERGHSPCPLVRDLLQQRLEENRKQLQQLQILQKRMEDCLKKWARMGDGIPDGEQVCHLIESLAE